MKHKVKIRVCVPHPNHVGLSPETEASLESLLRCNEVEVLIRKVQASSISYGRNLGINGREKPDGTECHVKQSGFDFDYLLTVDSDIAFTPDDVLRLMDRDLDIVSGLYQDRCNSDNAVAGHFNEYGVVDRTSMLPYSATGLIKVDWVGAGFMLIKRVVFEKMEFPWYIDCRLKYKDKDGNDCAIWVGEDVGFCLGARNAGLEIFCDCDVKVKHLTESNELKYGSLTNTQLNQRSSNMEATLNGKIEYLQGELGKIRNSVAEYRAEVERLDNLEKEVVGMIKAYAGLRDELATASETAADTKAGGGDTAGTTGGDTAPPNRAAKRAAAKKGGK